MTVYLKVDNSESAKEVPFYFSDGGANISENMDYREAVDRQMFLKSIGITVESRI